MIHWFELFNFYFSKAGGMLAIFMSRVQRTPDSPVVYFFRGNSPQTHFFNLVAYRWQKNIKYHGGSNFLGVRMPRLTIATMLLLGSLAQAKTWTLKVQNSDLVMTMEVPESWGEAQFQPAKEKFPMDSYKLVYEKKKDRGGLQISLLTRKDLKDDSFVDDGVKVYVEGWRNGLLAEAQEKNLPISEKGTAYKTYFFEMTDKKKISPPDYQMSIFAGAQIDRKVFVRTQILYDEKTSPFKFEALQAIQTMKFK